MNTLNITKKDNYAIVQLNRGKVNAVNLEMLEELSATFQSIKLKTRQSWLESFGKNKERDLIEALEIWWKREVRARIKDFVERLTKRSQV